MLSKKEINRLVKRGKYLSGKSEGAKKARRKEAAWYKKRQGF